MPVATVAQNDNSQFFGNSRLVVLLAGASRSELQVAAALVGDLIGIALTIAWIGCFRDSDLRKGHLRRKFNLPF